MSEIGVFQEQLSPEVWMVGVRGRLDQALSPRLDESLIELIGDGRTQLVVDLTGVTYINSGGLRCLVSAWRKAQKQNGDVVLFGLNARLQEIFSMIGFDTVFRIYDARDSAEAAFDDQS
jgi:anti-sigma B factor antagonist